MPLADETALGLLETHGLVAGIEAADAMLKTADVRLVSVEQTIPALITIKIVGDVASVRAAVDAGRAAAERVGRVVSAHMIARPADEVRAMEKLDAAPARAAASAKAAAPAKTAAPSKAAAAPATAKPTRGAPASNDPDYESMTVRELRATVREISDFPIQGRDVARARKDELIEHLQKHRSS